MTQSFLPTKGRQSMCPSACLHAPRLVHAPLRTLLHPGSDRVHRPANIRCRRDRVLLLDQIAIATARSGFNFRCVMVGLWYMLRLAIPSQGPALPN